MGLAGGTMPAASPMMVLAAAAMLAAGVRADLPVHCLHPDLIGEWIFYKGADGKSPRVRCGHHQPDDVDGPNLGYPGKKRPNMKIESQVKIRLEEPNIAVDVATGEKGTWTTVYDEGFEVKLQGTIYFAFSKYRRQGPDDAEGMHPGYISECAYTLAGWYHNEEATNWGCYFGEKTQVSTGSKVAPVVIPPKASMRSQDTAASSFLQVGGMDRALLTEGMARRVKELNSRVNRTWTAKVYPELAGKSFLELQPMSGGPRFTKPKSAKAVMDDRPDREKYTDRDGKAFPDTFDWRSVDGVNYDIPTRLQGDCGSCFAIAAVSALEIRVAIATKGKEKPTLSPQEVVSCSMTNQGCAGGYPFLVGKHAHDFGIVPEKCMYYQAGDRDDASCSHRCQHPTALYKTKGYGYVGGYYGACSEVEMMRELYANGPIVVGFQAPADLQLYHSGIFSHTDDTVDKREHKNGMNMVKGLPWEATNHAVLLFGWGVEDGKKYWIVKNSWGEFWGENGFFRMNRGVDDCAFESMAVTVGTPQPPIKG